MELTDELRDAFRAVVAAQLALWNATDALEGITGIDWCVSDFEDICIAVNDASDLSDSDMELIIKDNQE